MGAFVFRRLLIAVPIMVGVSLLVFLMTRLAPGDPASFFVDPTRADPATMARVRAELGLDQALPLQYLAWASKVLHGDLGYSFTYGSSAWDVIVERIPVTFQLQLAAIVLAIAIAVPAGIVSAVKANSALDYSVTVGTLFGLSMPDFWFGLMLILIFSVGLGWLPATGTGQDASGVDHVKYYIMPTLVLALAYLAAFTRFMRASLLDVIRQDYVTTARAKGLASKTVLYGHALKNALIPIITVIGGYLPRLLGGSIIVETVFAWPGIGRLAYDAAFRRDYPVIMALALVTSLVIVVLNIGVDVLYRKVDPRITFGARSV